MNISHESVSPDTHRPAGPVLLVQLADLGDLMLAAPSIQHFRQAFPDRRVTLLTKPSNTVLAEKLADEVLVADKHLYDSPLGMLSPAALLKLLTLVIELRRRCFEEVFLLHHLVTRWGAIKFAALSLISRAPGRRGLDNGRGWFLTAAVHDRGFGAQREREYWTELLGGAADTIRLFERKEHSSPHWASLDQPYAVIHPGSGSYSTARRWPLEHFRELVAGLHQRLGLRIVVVGGADEAHLGDQLAHDRDYVLNISGETDLPDLSEVLEHADLFVGNDGGVAQLAGLLGTPGLVIYGPTSPKTWSPHGSRLRTVQLDLPCAPCLYVASDLGTPEGCATRECLAYLSPSRILDEAVDIVGQAPAA